MDQKGILRRDIALRTCFMSLCALLAIGVGEVLLIAYRLRGQLRSC